MSHHQNGALSGMLLPATTAGVIVPLALISPTFRANFDAPLSPGLLLAFFASVALMAVHKLESYWFGEFDQCPVYLTTGEAPWAQNPRKAVFLSFVPTFLGMMFLVCFAFVGPPWHLVILTIWLAQGAHELHHVAKSLARRKAYPGVFSSLLFVGVVCFELFPRWHDAVLGERGGLFFGFFAALPCVVLAFYAEDRWWLRDSPLPAHREHQGPQGSSAHTALP